ncbi:MAG: 3-phosphoshikimate 1-carboxyvinyltransferase, partial [Alphaproteobacteria bacterium]|nr:3-phosphoshikimate 1-carboxyvinyltransferase [Alphaproteobacteria bacterium]
GLGGQKPQGGFSGEANHDHRIAMSALVLGMAAKEPIAVAGAETISTSFPGFVALMNTLGGHIVHPANNS